VYQIIKDVLTSGRYELADMLTKIDTIWLQGDLDDDQRTELVQLARTNADPEQSYAPISAQLTALADRIKALETRVTALEGDSTEPEPEEWPAWVQPTGAHDAYNTGDKVTFEGRHYISRIDGNVWSPAVYPDGWEES
jgi:hypothetical protein